MRVKPIKKAKEVIEGNCYSDNKGTTIKIECRDECDYITGFLVVNTRSIKIESRTLLDYLLDGTKSFYLISQEEFDLRLNEAIEKLKTATK